MDMVERVARKMCALDGHRQNTQYEGKPMWASYAEEARTIIMTMREPTKAMEVAWGRNSPGGSNAQRDWNSMIDAALAKPPHV
ncbi:hypothetical protein ABIC16_004176 [Sphingomonas sp. PvP055]|jgi:hypothetical protein|uniref:hypothetical protein n=1 Tax=Sphingomonas sp. PvP055 TaxID=3156391 RepID=UPI0033935901